MSIFAIQPSFARGEISPRLYSRLDISHYPLALKECTNFTVLRQGGLTRRTGTKFVNEVKNSNQRVRLIEFVFSTEQAYILEFGHLYFRVYALGGRVESPPGTPVEVATPWTQAQIFGLHFVQSADVLYVAHENHRPRKITRTSDTNWTIENFAFRDGPYLPQEFVGTTLTPAARGSIVPIMTSNTTPSGTVASNTSSSSAWQAFDGNAGNPYADTTASQGWLSYTPTASRVCDAYWIKGANNRSFVSAPATWTFEGFNGSSWVVLDSRQEETGWSRGETRYYEFENETAYQAYRINWTATDTTANTDSAIAEMGWHERAENQTPFNLTASSTNGVNDGQGFLASDVGRAIRLRASDGRWRWAEIVARSSSTVVTIRLHGHALPDTSPITAWQMGAFSAFTGWPARVGFYQERLVWARTKRQPQTVWFSKAGILDDYGTSQPVLDDDGVTLTILSESVNEIMWVKEGTDLLIGTREGIRSLGPGDASNAFSPTNILQKRHVNYGAFPMQPVEIGQATLYIDRFRTGVREAMYSFENDQIVAPEVTVLSEHIFGRGISDRAYSAHPQSVLWMALDTGELAGVTYEREQEMFASHVHRIGGSFGSDEFGHVESVATIPGDDGDELWMVVKRTIDGSTKRYIERLSGPFSGAQEEAFFVDSGLTYNGAPTNSFTGLGHLEGEEVAILGDGAVFPRQTVVDGAVALPDEAEVERASIGLPYHSQVHTLDPGVSRGDGSGLGRRKKIVKVMVDLLETGNIMCRTASSDNAEIVLFRSTGDFMDQPVPLKSGFFEVRPDGRWKESPGEVVFFTDAPLPATIRSITPVLEVEP